MSLVIVLLALIACLLCLKQEERFGFLFKAILLIILAPVIGFLGDLVLGFFGAGLGFGYRVLKGMFGVTSMPAVQAPAWVDRVFTFLGYGLGAVYAIIAAFCVGWLVWVCVYNPDRKEVARQIRERGYYEVPKTRV